jgi:RNA polymerase sigma factor (sigma-70 family)
VSIKKLNLEEIQEEVLNECFEEETTNLDNLGSLDLEEETKQEDNTSSSDLTMDKIKASVKSREYVSNEELIRKIQSGEDVEESKKLLVLYNSGLVYTEAKNCTCNIPFQDKVQYGFEGLMKAIYGFDPSFRTMFSTYATTAIRQYMYRNGNNDVRMVALPEHLSVSNIKIQSFIERFISDSNGYPTNEQISEATGIDIRAVKRIMNYNSNTFSIDTPMNRSEEGSEQTLKDIIPGESADYVVDERCLSKDFLAVMEEIMDELEEHERVLLGLVHGLDGYRVHTFDEVITSGYIDGKGKFVTSKATLSRRYNDMMDKVRRIVVRNNINFE